MRGRKALPDAVKEAKGNPGKRRLDSLDEAKRGGDAVAEKSEASAPPQIQIPEFLTQERERTIFRRVVEDYLQRRIARPADFTAYARWAHYLDRWIAAKETLEGKSEYYKVESQHGTYIRPHPAVSRMHNLERDLRALEDRLGLTPASRQSIVRGLAALPSAIAGDLYGDKPPLQPEAPDGEPDAPSATEVMSSGEFGPLNFLERAGGKPH